MKSLLFKFTITLGIQIVIFTLLFVLFSFNNHASAQVKIGDNPSTIDNSSALELESTDKGFLIPRMTRIQRQAISSPATALMVYQTDSSAGFYYYNGTDWETLLADTLEYREGGRNLNVVGKGTGSTKTTTIIVDNTVGEQFDIGDELYFDVSDPIDYAGGDISINVDFISMGAESGKTVRWKVDYKIHQPFTIVSGSSGIIDSGDMSLSSTQYDEQDFVFTIPASELVGAEAIHFKLIRATIGAGSNPATDPAVLHCNVRYNSVR
jgi:hypothetical protein